MTFHTSHPVRGYFRANIPFLYSLKTLGNQWLSNGCLMFLGGIEEEHQPKTGPSKPAITCSKLTIDTLELGVKHVQYVWIYFTPCSCVSIVNFEQINAGWDYTTSMASYIFHKPNKMTRKEINLNILMFTLLSVLFTKSLVSYENLQKLYFVKIDTNIHMFLEIFPSFGKSC